MNYFVVLLAVLLSFNAFSLEMDEKLTLRIVNTSQTKKTIVINRGIEDGLVKGDHAKFFVSSGVIARGVAIKLSPTRSVWSIYRVVNTEFLKEEQVMRLKITPPVKITKDESRMLVTDATANSVNDPRDLGIPLAEGADDVDPMNSQMAISSQAYQESNVSLLSKNRELFGVLNYNSYTESTVPDTTGGTTFTNTVTELFMRVGAEWYFKTQSELYDRFSFVTSFTIDRKAVMAHHGTYVSEQSSEFGFGVSMYPFERPSKTRTIISYINYTFGLGSSSSAYIIGEEFVGYPSETLDASTIIHDFSYGLKYNTNNGFGVRGEFSYRLRSDEYGSSQDGTSWLKSRTGLKVLWGVSYRY